MPYRKLEWREGGARKGAPYRPEPEKNVVFSEEQAAEIKRRKAEVRRMIEDEKIDREIEEMFG